MAATLQPIPARNPDRATGETQLSTVRARFDDFLSPDEFSELAGDYPRATADLNRLNRRVTRRGRVNFDGE